MISASAMAQMLGATNRLGVFPAYGDKFQQAGRVMSSRRRLGRQPGIGDRRRPRRRTGRVRTAHPLRLNAIEHKWGYETAFRAKGQAAIGGRGRPGPSGQSLMIVHQGRGLAQDKYGRPVRDQRSSFGVVVAGGRPSSILRVWSISATSNVSDGKAVR